MSTNLKQALKCKKDLFFKRVAIFMGAATSHDSNSAVVHSETEIGKKFS